MRFRGGIEFTWHEFGSRLYAKVTTNDVLSHAAQVAFYFSFALFPLLYFLVSLFGILLDSSQGLKDQLFEYLRQIMPLSVFELVRKTVDEIIANSSGGKATLGLVVTLWSASSGVDAVRNGLNAVYGLKERRSWYKTKTQSIVLTFVITALAGLVLASVFYGWQLIQAALGGIGLTITSPLILIVVQWLSTLLVMLLACEIIYNLLPDFPKYRWIWITPGSLVAIVLWIVLTTAFRTYLGYFNSYNKAYGSLGAVIIMMLWLYLTATALMVGGAINSVFHDLGLGSEAGPELSEVVTE